MTVCFISKITEYNDILKSFDSVDPSLAILDIYTSIQLVAWENDSEKKRNDSYENICIELSYPPPHSVRWALQTIAFVATCTQTVT